MLFCNSNCQYQLSRYKAAWIHLLNDLHWLGIDETTAIFVKLRFWENQPYIHGAVALQIQLFTFQMPSKRIDIHLSFKTRPYPTELVENWAQDKFKGGGIVLFEVFHHFSTISQRIFAVLSLVCVGLEFRHTVHFISCKTVEKWAIYCPFFVQRSLCHKNYIIMWVQTFLQTAVSDYIFHLFISVMLCCFQSY